MGENKPLAVVAGSASGIGKCAAAKLFSRFHVIGIDLNRTDLPGVESVEIDITDRESVQNLVRSIESRGKVDVLVVSAAVHNTHPAEFLPDELIDNVVDINLISHIKLVRDFLPVIRNGGSIIGVSSIAACVGVPMSSLYSASKRGLEGFYESLYTELSYRDIRVSVIHPGNVNTGFNETGNTYTPGCHPGVDEHYLEVVGRIDSTYGISPEKVAGVIDKVVRRKHPRFSYVVGMNALKANLARKLLGRDLALKLMGKFFGF